MILESFTGSEQSTGNGRNNNNRPAIGGPFKLFDTENHSVTESSFRGNWILMYFGYTSSPDVGPAEVKKMAEVMKILGELFLPILFDLEIGYHF